MSSNLRTTSKESQVFQDFSKGYLEPGSLTRNKPSVAERLQSSAGNNMRDELKDYFNNIPNGKTSGNTWDAKHLDRFLNSSQWGANPSAMRTQATFANRSNSLPHGRNTSLTQTGVEGGGASRKSEKNSSIDPRESWCFTNSARMGPEQTFIYDFSYREPEYNINQAVTNPRVLHSTLQNHYFKMFTRSPAPFGTENLEFSIKRDESPLPRVRREQLEENIKNQRSFREWKENSKQITKRNRIYHSAFRSGVVGLDNPLYESTLIYREEHDNMRRQTEEKRKIEEKHKKDLTHFNRTSAEVQFLNKNSKLIDESPERMKAYRELPIVQGNRKTKVDMEWARRARKTQDRIFGAEVKPYSVNRAEYLRAQELRGKRYDIVSNGVNDVSIRQDIPRRSSSVFDHPLGKSILEKD